MPQAFCFVHYAFDRSTRRKQILEGESLYRAHFLMVTFLLALQVE